MHLSVNICRVEGLLLDRFCSRQIGKNATCGGGVTGMTSCEWKRQPTSKGGQHSRPIELHENRVGLKRVPEKYYAGTGFHSKTSFLKINYEKDLGGGEFCTER